MGRIISMTQKGNFKKTEGFLSKIIGFHFDHKLAYYGAKGVDALKSTTPKESGHTADCWSYEIVREPGRTAIYWRNSHVVNGTNIAIILQYGHGTRNGGYVEGIDYINPAIQPIFRQMADEVWKEVVQ